MTEPGPLDVERQRNVRELLRDTLSLYRQNLGTILLVTAAVVVTVDFILGLGLNEIGSRYRAKPRAGVTVIQFLVSLLVITPLINAAAAHLVHELAQGRRPRSAEVLQRGLDVFAPALVAVVIYSIGFAAGTLMFVFPGLYVLVLWYFTTQTVTIERRRAFGALQRSGELVGPVWLSTAWRLLVLIVLGNYVPALLLGRAVDAAAKAADAQAVELVGMMAIQLLSLPFVALAAALLYFELRSRAASRAGAS